MTYDIEHYRKVRCDAKGTRLTSDGQDLFYLLTDGPRVGNLFKLSDTPFPHQRSKMNKFTSQCYSMLL